MNLTHRQESGVAFAIGAYVFWGLVPLYYAPFPQIPAFEMLAHRALWTVVALVPLLFVFGLGGEIRRAFTERRTLLILVASALCIGGNWVIFMWAMTHGKVIDTSLGYFINPLFNVLLGVVFLRERLRPMQIFSVALAALGVGILIYRTGSLPWVALALPLLFGIYSLLRKLVTVHTFVALFVETAILAPFGLCYALYLGSQGTSSFMSGGIPLIFWFLGLGPITILPLSLFGAAAKRITLTALGFCQYIAPTMTFVLGVFFFREPFDRVQLITFALIWVSLVAFTIDGVRAPSKTPPAPAEA